jgi:hypothetical protein
MAATPVRTWSAGRVKLHVNRSDPEAWPLFLIYPLRRGGGKRGLLVTIGYRRFELRW